MINYSELKDNLMNNANKLLNDNSSVVKLKIDVPIVVRELTHQSWFPYKTGNLQSSVKTEFFSNNLACITFSGDKVKYLTALEEGSEPHDIPNSFGYGMDYGIGGRFNGKFHPGSMIHKGFISNNSVQFVIDYFINKYQGTLGDEKAPSNFDIIEDGEE